MIDGNQADDKIIAVLLNDTVYGHFKDITEVPPIVIQRLEHYFLTYKDMPGQTKNTEITHTYGHDEAIEVIKQSITDYQARFDNLGKLMY
jgi:inorganic pyrophosphatase